MEKLFNPLNIVKGVDLAITASTLPYLANPGILNNLTTGNFDGTMALNAGLLISYIYRRLIKGTMIDIVGKSKVINNNQFHKEIKEAADTLPSSGKAFLYAVRAASWDIVWPTVIGAFSYINQQTHLIPQLIQLTQGLIK